MSRVAMGAEVEVRPHLETSAIVGLGSAYQPGLWIENLMIVGLIHSQINKMISILLLFCLLPNLSSQKSILMTRHGARSPNHYSQLNKELWKDFPEGYLTTTGIHMAMDLGAKFRNLSIYDAQGHCDLAKLNIESATKERIILSAIAFLKGLCPLNYQVVIKRFLQEKFSNLTQDAAAFEAILDSDFADLDKIKVDIFDRKDDFLFKGGKVKVCPRLKKVNKKVLKMKVNRRKLKQLKKSDAFPEVLALLNEENSKQLREKDVTFKILKKFYGNYMCNQFQGFDEPKLSTKAQTFLYNNYKYVAYRIKNRKLFQHRANLSELSKWILQQVQSPNQLSLYSGGDQNMIAMLAILQKEEFVPLFSSTLEFKVLGEHIEVYYLSRPLKTRVCGNGFKCTISEFQEFFQKYIVKNIKKMCHLRHD